MWDWCEPDTTPPDETTTISLTPTKSGWTCATTYDDLALTGTGTFDAETRLFNFSFSRNGETTLYFNLTLRGDELVGLHGWADVVPNCPCAPCSQYPGKGYGIAKWTEKQ